MSVRSTAPRDRSRPSRPARAGQRDAVAGDGQGLALAEAFQQPVDVFRRMRHAQAHEGDAGSLELTFGLFEVARVGPQPGEIAGHDQGAGGAVEAGQPLPCLPVLGQVFGQVRVGAGNQAGMDVLRAHGFAQGGKAGGDLRAHPRMLAVCASGLAPAGGPDRRSGWRSSRQAGESGVARVAMRPSRACADETLRGGPAMTGKLLKRGTCMFCRAGSGSRGTGAR